MTNEYSEIQSCNCLYNAVALTFELHLISIRWPKRSDCVLFRLAHRISEPVLYERSIDPDEAGKESESLATTDRNGKR